MSNEITLNNIFFFKIETTFLFTFENLITLGNKLFSLKILTKRENKSY